MQGEGKKEGKKNEQWMDGGNIYNPILTGGGRGIRNSHSSSLTYTVSLEDSLHWLRLMTNQRREGGRE